MTSHATCNTNHESCAQYTAHETCNNIGIGRAARRGRRWGRGRRCGKGRRWWEVQEVEEGQEVVAGAGGGGGAGGARGAGGGGRGVGEGQEVGEPPSAVPLDQRHAYLPSIPVGPRDAPESQIRGPAADCSSAVKRGPFNGLQRRRTTVGGWVRAGQVLRVCWGCVTFCRLRICSGRFPR